MWRVSASEPHCSRINSKYKKLVSVVDYEELDSSQWFRYRIIFLFIRIYICLLLYYVDEFSAKGK